MNKHLITVLAVLWATLMSSAAFSIVAYAAVYEVNESTDAYPSTPAHVQLPAAAAAPSEAVISNIYPDLSGYEKKIMQAYEETHPVSKELNRVSSQYPTFNIIGDATSQSPVAVQIYGQAVALGGTIYKGNIEITNLSEVYIGYAEGWYTGTRLGKNRMGQTVNVYSFTGQMPAALKKASEDMNKALAKVNNSVIEMKNYIEQFYSAEILKNPSAKADLLYLKGDTYLKESGFLKELLNKDYDFYQLCVQSYEESVATMPLRKDLALKLGLFYYERTDYQQVYKKYLTLWEADKDYLHKHMDTPYKAFMEAKIYYDKGQFDKALELATTTANPIFEMNKLAARVYLKKGIDTLNATDDLTKLAPAFDYFIKSEKAFNSLPPSSAGELDAYYTNAFLDENEKAAFTGAYRHKGFETSVVGANTSVFMAANQGIDVSSYSAVFAATNLTMKAFTGVHELSPIVLYQYFLQGKSSAQNKADFLVKYEPTRALIQKTTGSFYEEIVSTFDKITRYSWGLDRSGQFVFSMTYSQYYENVFVIDEDGAMWIQLEHFEDGKRTVREFNSPGTSDNAGAGNQGMTVNDLYLEIRDDVTKLMANQTVNALIKEITGDDYGYIVEAFQNKTPNPAEIIYVRDEGRLYISFQFQKPEGASLINGRVEMNIWGNIEMSIKFTRFNSGNNMYETYTTVNRG